MAAFVADELITKYTLQDNYSPKARQITASTLQMTAAQQHATAGFGAFATTARSGAVAVGIAALALAGLVGGVVAYVRLHQELISQGSVLMRHAGEWESLGMALQVVEGNAAAAQIRMQQLREMARSPGLGFAESISGYVGFRRAGLPDEFSRRLLAELGNQVALSGGGRDMFGRLSYAASELARQPFLQGDELRQFTEAGLPAHRIVSEAFGTSDTEQLKKRGITAQQVLLALLAAMEAMPRAGESAKNTFDNLGDAIDYARARAGAAVNEAFLPMVQSFVNVIDVASDAGIVDTVFQNLAGSLDYLSVSGTSAERAMLMAGAGLMTFGDMAALAAAGVGGLIDSLFPLIRWAMGANAGSVLDLIESRFDVNMRTLEMQMDLHRKRQARKEPEDEAKTPVSELLGQNPALPILREIAFNTEPLRIDYSRNILGGGDLGRLGVTPVELGGVLGRSRPIRIEAPKGPMVITDAEAFVIDIVKQLRRQGALA
jgi:tape measure domain-containing protein